MLLQQRNNFSFCGLTETYIAEDAEYMTIFEFEKRDYIPVYNWLAKNLPYLIHITGAYLALIFLTHSWMKDRKPFKLRKPLFVWNVFLSVLSLVMVSRFLPELLHINRKYGFYRSYCKFDHLNQATAFWLQVYGCSKVLEFIDTLFIILRKQKLTFLHTFHHASIFVSTFYGLFRMDSAARYFIIVNSFVHFVMYGYYAMKVAQINLPRKLAMAITSVQLLQFVAIIIMNGLVVYAKVTGAQPSCERSYDVTALFFGLGVVYFGLFGNFFINSYLTNKLVKAKPQ